MVKVLQFGRIIHRIATEHMRAEVMRLWRQGKMSTLEIAEHFHLGDYGEAAVYNTIAEEMGVLDGAGHRQGVEEAKG